MISPLSKNLEVDAGPYESDRRPAWSGGQSSTFHREGFMRSPRFTSRDSRLLK